MQLHCSLIIFVCLKHMQWYFQNFVGLKRINSIFGRLYSWLSFSLQHNFSSLLFYSLPSSDALVLKHYYILHFSWLLNVCPRKTLLACGNSYKILFLLLFIIYTEYFLILREYNLVHPHCWALPSLTTENMCLETTFTIREGYARKDGIEISSSSFQFDDFRTWPRSPIEGLLRTACIVL